MNWPQITLIILFAFGLGVTAIRHGEPRNDKYSFWWQLAGNPVIVWLLWCGGFFSQARAAQPPQAALQYRDDVIRNARLEWGLSAPVADFAAQLHQESGWRPDVVSPAGAQGLAQFMPATADWISQLIPMLSNREPFNPAWAIRALVSYDRWLWQRVSAANDCERMAMTLSGYNGGLGWVQRDRRLASQKGLDSTRWFGHVATVNAGRNAASWRENRHYPQRILRELAPRYLTWEAAVVWHLVKSCRGAAFCWPFLSMPFWSACMPWDTEVVMTLQSVTVIPRSVSCSQHLTRTKRSRQRLRMLRCGPGPDGIRSRWPPGSGLKPVILSRLLNWRAGINNYRGKLTMSHSAGLMKR